MPARLRALDARWALLARTQLAEEVNRLSARVEELEDRLGRAEECAEFWAESCRDAHDCCEQSGVRVYMDKGGNFIHVTSGRVADRAPTAESSP